jgi:hypothetical protein
MFWPNVLAKCFRRIQKHYFNTRKSYRGDTSGSTTMNSVTFEKSGLEKLVHIDFAMKLIEEYIIEDLLLWNGWGVFVFAIFHCFG